MIPTRLGSTRFPGKALADETGRPLILHVVDRARAALSVERVIVTAPDPEIIRIVEEAGVEAIETSFDHPNGTSRLAEVADRLADIGAQMNSATVIDMERWMTDWLENNPTGAPGRPPG